MTKRNLIKNLYIRILLVHFKSKTLMKNYYKNNNKIRILNNPNHQQQGLVVVKMKISLSRKIIIKQQNMLGKLTVA